MAKVKGTAVKASIAFLKENAEGDTFESLLDQLEPHKQEILRQPILQSSWYDFTLLLDLMAAAEGRISPPPGRTLAWEMGRFSADHGLKTIYRVFFKVADPGFIIRKASQVFSTYYDSGSMEVASTDDRTALLRLTDFNQPHVWFCDRLMGWMERTLELSGAKSPRVSHPKCLARGDASCDYCGRWQ
jgi:hypothetical protein